MSTTIQSVEIDSKDGRTFLRKVAKHNLNSSYSEEWRVYAGDSSSWKVQFRRTIKGAVGSPDEDIEVDTDIVVRLRGKFGQQQSFSDAKPVIVLTPHAIHLSGSTAGLFAKLAMDGWRFEVCGSSGSTSSSEYGLAFYSLNATHPDFPYANLAVGGDSVSKDGRCICSSAVSI